MEIICFEKKAFEEFDAKIERFLQRVAEMPGLKGVGKSNEWLDHYEVCRKLRISKRTLQTLRDRRLIGYSQINRRFYYKPEEVKRLIPLVGTLYPGGK